MRISQLSAASGVPIPTIKYYLREGLLPAGEQTSATRAEYGERHVRRLRLIRALLEVGRLPIAAIRKVLAAVDDETLSMHLVLGTAHYALAPEIESHPDDEAWHEARSETDRLIAELGWRIAPAPPPVTSSPRSSSPSPGSACPPPAKPCAPTPRRPWSW
nr:hypothetical protein GCM10020093_102070 [Planobispora longispora]